MKRALAREQSGEPLVSDRSRVALSWGIYIYIASPNPGQIRDRWLTQVPAHCSPTKAQFVNVLPLCSSMLPRCSPLLPFCSAVLPLSHFFLFSCHCILASIPLLLRVAATGANWTTKHEKGRCAIRGQCAKQSFLGGELPCPDNGLAEAPDTDTQKKLVASLPVNEGMKSPTSLILSGSVRVLRTQGAKFVSGMPDPLNA